MPEREALPVIMRYRVKNPDASDYGRVGVAVDILDESDLQQRTTWIVLDFENGDEPASFHKDELERVHV